MSSFSDAHAEIDRRASDLERHGFELRGLPVWVDAPAVMTYLDEIGALAALCRLYSEGNRLGGAALVAVLEDGLPPHMPVDSDRINDVVSLELLERDEISPHRRSGALSHYVIGTARTELTAASIVHASRVIISNGARLSPSEEAANNGWGDSMLMTLQAETAALGVKSGREWARLISGEQKRWLRPRLRTILGWAFSAKGGPTGGRVPGAFTVEFQELTPAAQELTPAATVDRGVLSIFGAPPRWSSDERAAYLASELGAHGGDVRVDDSFSRHVIDDAIGRVGPVWSVIEEASGHLLIRVRRWA